MSAAQHTPGPWFGDGEPSNGVISIYHPTEGDIGFVLYGASIDAECRANARLSAAAPELLEALLEILGPLNVCSDNPNVRDDVCLPIDMTMGELRRARAAIARATGADA